MMRRWLLIAPFALAPVIAHAEQTCVALDGDEATCRDLAAILTSRGVALASTSAPSCALIRAHVEPRGTRFAVLLDDGDRKSEREVSDRRVAASLIESWARDDLSAPLFESEPVGGPRLVIAPVAEDPARGPAEDVAIVPSGAAFEVAFHGGVSTSDDGSLWYNLSARAFTELAMFRPSFSLRMIGGGVAANVFQTPADRIGGDALLGLDLPIDLEVLTLRPGIGLGVGWLRTARAAVDRASCEAGLCAPTAVIADEFVHSSAGPRGEAHLAIAVPIAGQWALELDLAATFAPLATRDALIPTYASELSSDDQSFFALPGEPLWLGHAALGLRWEAM